MRFTKHSISFSPLILAILQHVRPIESIFCELDVPEPDCVSCLSENCAWATGQCLISCDVIADVACYEISATDNITPTTVEQVCQLEQLAKEDDFACSSAKTCTDCVSTSLPSDSNKNCLWQSFEGDPNSSFCKKGCDMLGCGSDKCPPEEQGNEEIQCKTFSDCTSCIDAGCGWTGGACLDSCNMIADIPCYDTQYNGNSFESSESVCLIEQQETQDYLTCSEKENCLDCISTTLISTKGTCQWQESTDEKIPSKCKSTCDLSGCGSIECPRPIFGNEPQDTSDPEPEPEPEPEPAQTCEELKDCESCVNAGCGFVSPSMCLPNCLVIADVDCYESTDTGSTAEEICQAKDNDIANYNLCSEKENCLDCISTTLISTEGTCQWQESTDENRPSKCKSTCDLSGCGSIECPRPIFGNEPQDTSDPEPEPAQTCEELKDCESCVDAGCGFVSPSMCLPNCSVIADVDCYESAGTRSTPEEICQAKDNDIANYNLCSSIDDCSECVSTQLVGSTETCMWQNDDWVQEKCKRSCNMLGCGSTDPGQCPTDNEELRIPESGSSIMAEMGTPEAVSAETTEVATSTGEVEVETSDEEVSCDDNSACLSCLESECAWAAGMCLNSCDEIADVSCYSAESETAEQTCNKYESDTEDSTACFESSTCSECVNTFLPSSNETETCNWDVEGSYCKSGCDMLGCGVQECLDEVESEPETDNTEIGIVIGARDISRAKANSKLHGVNLLLASLSAIYFMVKG